MKISLLTDEFTQDAAEAAAWAVHRGVDGVELRSVGNFGPFELSIGEAREIATSIEDAGLKVSALCPPLYKCNVDDEAQVLSHLAGLEHCIELAGIFGTGLIRAFSFWRAQGPRPIELVADRFRTAAQTAGDAGVKLALENDPSTNACNAVELAELLDAIGSPHAGALWDPGNNLFAPAFEQPFPDGYERIKKHLLHVHLKDAVTGADGRAEACVLGAGQAGIPELLRALAADSYGGFVTLEPHYRRHAALTKAEMLLPGGARFSEGGEGPMSECLGAVQSILGRTGGKENAK
jgi:sugar phosphate isomerase/epimerase